MRASASFMLVVAVAAGLSGCSVVHRLRGGLQARSCASDNAIYTRATSVPNLKIPVGIDPPQTESKSALKLPALNEPAPPPRSATDPCLDEPPKYTEPKGPRPVPAA